MNNKGVRTEGIEEISKMTLENLLMEKFRELQLAREAGEPAYFDALSQSIEILLKASPNAYTDLMSIKEEMQKELEQEYTNIQNAASQAQDEIYRKSILETRIEEADWLFRITYEEFLIEIFQKNQLIGIASSEVPRDLLPNEEPQEIVEQEELDTEPKGKKRLRIGKPKLMKQQ